MPEITKRRVHVWWCRPLPNGTWKKVGWSDDQVVVVFQSDPENKDYAPTITYVPGKTANLLAKRVNDALIKVRGGIYNLVDAMIDELGATRLKFDHETFELVSALAPLEQLAMEAPSA